MLTVAYGEATLDRSNVYNIDEVKKIVLVNRQITVREVAEGLNISIGSCHSIYTTDLGMKLVPKLLNFDQKLKIMGLWLWLK